MIGATAGRSGGVLRLATALAIILVCFRVQAQISFQRTYDPASGGDYGQCVVQAPDGGFFVAGLGIVADSVVSGGAAVLRTDALGDTLWYRGYTTPGSTDLSLEHIILSSDGNLVVTGIVNYGAVGGISDYDAYIAKIDPAGNMLWSNTVGGPFKQWGKQVREVPNGGYLVTGWQWPSCVVNCGAYYLIRLNNVGDTLWTKDYPNFNNPAWDQLAYCMEVMPDSGFVLAGKQRYWSWNYVHAIRTNTEGDTLWTRTLDALGEAEARDVEVLTNGHIMIAGISFPGGGYARPLLLELDENGDLLWYQNYEHAGAGLAEWCYSMCKTTTGYALLNMDSNYNAFWLTNVDQAGDTLWTKGFIGPWAYAYGLEQTSDGGFVMTGIAQTPDARIALIKTDASGNVITSTHDITIHPSVAVSLFPNPVAAMSTFQYTTAGVGDFTLVLHDATGRVVRSIFTNTHRAPGRYDEPIDLTGLATGNYTLVLSNGAQAVSAKAIKQ